MNSPKSMSDLGKKIKFFLRRFTPLKILIPILLISVISAVAFAASATISTTPNYQGVQGVQYQVSGLLTASNVGFFVTQTAATASSQPATWSAGGTVTTATVAGDWQYEVTIATQTGCAASTTYTVTVYWNTGTALQTTMGSLQFTTPATIVNGASMTFIFNTGVNTFNAPVGVTITVG